MVARRTKTGDPSFPILRCLINITEIVAMDQIYEKLTLFDAASLPLLAYTALTVR
jgi:hypothetical protein